MSFSWFISVDDHLIEPARLWQERVPERMRDRAPRTSSATATPSSGSTRTARSSPPASTPSPARRARSSRPSRSPTTTCARAATSPPPASPTWTRATCCRRCCSRRSRATAARSSTRPRTRTSRSTACRRGTTSSSRSSPATFPGRFIPMMIIPLWDPAAAAAEIERTAGARRQVDRVLREPDQARPAVDPHRLLGPGVRGRQRHRLRALDARRLVVEPDPHVRRHADARVHGLLGGRQPGRHAARLAVQRQLRAVPRTSRSRCPRGRSAGSRTSSSGPSRSSTSSASGRRASTST